MFEKITLSDKMSDKDVLRFLNLPEDTVVYYSPAPLWVNEIQSKDSKLFVCRYGNRFTTGEFGEVMLVGKYKKVSNSGYRYIKGNLNGPSWLCFSNEVNVSYFVDNLLHRVTGPANIVYDYNGTVIKERYLINSKLHSPVGPALREKTNRGWYNCFYLHGKQISLNEFCNNIERRWSNG